MPTRITRSQARSVGRSSCAGLRPAGGTGFDPASCTFGDGGAVIYRVLLRAMIQRAQRTPAPRVPSRSVSVDGSTATSAAAAVVTAHILSPAACRPVTGFACPGVHLLLTVLPQQR